MNTDKKDITSDLATKIWKTKGSRLNAYRRLNVRAKLSLYLISIYSAYVLIASIFEKEFSAAIPNYPSAPNVILISLSLFILIISIIEGTSRSEIIANNLHENAKKLTPLLNKLEIIRNHPSPETSIAQLEKINKKYSSIIDSCSDNHSPIDYEKFKLEHSELKGSVEHPLLTHLRYHFFKIAFIVAITIPIFIVFALIYFAQ
ncbi:SLATT domain-containing protein [Pseudomonas sp.]|uniref:SLATT domain-containing protein n=1 Tax=Pseudomonas sp. TaxID=306 RepID=UPI003D10F240